MQDHGVGEEGVQAHARCQRDRIVGDDAHDCRADGGCQAGRDKHRAFVHPGFAEDARVHEEDVGHRQEGGDTRKNLGSHSGVVCFELKQPFQHASPRGATGAVIKSFSTAKHRRLRPEVFLSVGKSRASYQQHGRLAALLTQRRDVL